MYSFLLTHRHPIVFYNIIKTW